jgi:anti-sigma B factor antagonist
LSESRRLEVGSTPARDGFTVISASGEIDLVSVHEFRDELRGALERGPVVVDLHGVEFCDSAGLRTLVEAHRHAEARSTALRIAAPSAAVTRILELSGADTVLAVFSDIDAALAGDAGGH